MTYKRNLEVLKKSKGRTFTFTFSAPEIGVLHRAVRLMLLHPAVEGISDLDESVFGKLLSFCFSCLSKMGFTETEIAEMDSALEEDAPGLTIERF